MLEDESFGSAMCTIDFEKKVPNNIYIDCMKSSSINYDWFNYVQRK
jgi:hypothetical protein